MAEEDLKLNLEEDDERSFMEFVREKENEERPNSPWKPPNEYLPSL